MSSQAHDDELPDFTIVGCGLAGALMACYLGRAGHRVVLYEKRADPRKAGAFEGRSINLALSTRGIHALREVGLADEVLKSAIPMRGRMIHDERGALSYQPYGKDESQAINSVSRGGLNVTLLDAAERLPNVRVVFQHRCQDIDLETNTLRFAAGQDEETVVVRARSVIGADGAYSALRERMQHLGRFDYSQEFLGHGYKELTIPAAEGGGFRMERNALHIWPRGHYMMIALPNVDGTFTCTLFWPFEGPSGFDALTTDEAVRRHFETHFPDAVPHLPALIEEYRRNPVGSLMTVRCRPWRVTDKLVLLGDACHAVVPFFGQGMNCAFEDCAVLNECLARHPGDRAAAFEAYEWKRKENADALAGLCVENFYEMRDHVASASFLLKKKLSLLLYRLFPNAYVPLYNMVTFTRIPYAEAVRRAAAQERALKLALGLGLAAGTAALFALLHRYS
ncbi:MAG: FAD-dependent monooxygenase [Planctomycetota bacterium]|nr:FAD-dependent monooxygenase [Planctomycetota bacterium]